MDTLGSMRAAILRFNKDDEDTQLVNDAINDGIESLWRSALLVSVEQFLSGPITSLTVSQGNERETIIAIPDPPAFTAAQVSSTAGGALGARTEYVAITLVTPSGSETNVSGSTDNPPGTIPTPYANVVAANFLSTVQAPTYPLVPVPTGYGSPTPYSAIGWNLYMGIDPNNLCKQNKVPLLFNQIWQEPQTGLIVNSPQQQNSPPTINGTADNVCYIALMEVQNPDMTWTRWDQTAIDSLLMERCVRTIAPQTTFQKYAYDLVNGTTLEIRPAAGMTLNPRYFYVVKPYRLAFDNAIIPFTTMSYTEFIKMYAQAQLDRSNKEFTSAGANANQAEKVRGETLAVLNKNSTRQKTITPFFRW